MKNQGYRIFDSWGKEKVRRPILFPAFFYVYGIVLGYQLFWIDSTIFHLALACVASIVIFVVFNKIFRLSRKNMVIFLCCFVFGIGNLFLNTLSNNDATRCLNENHKFLLKVENGISADSEKIKLDCTCLEVDNNDYIKEFPVRVSIYDKNQNIKDYYDNTIELQGKLASPKPNTNPHCFNYKTYLKSIGIEYTLTANKAKIVREGNSIKKSLLQTKEEYLEFLQNNFQNSESVDMIRGIVFGDKSRLDEEIYDSFRSNGTAHVLAVSGLHVGLIFAAMRKLLQKRNKKLYYMATVLVLVGYGTVTQWSVSVVRAILMIIIFLAGEVIHRRYDMLSGAVFAAFILLTINPFQLFNCGFQMSFLAVMGISFFARRFQKYMPSYFSMLTSIQLVLMPYMAYEFNYISVAALIVNYPSTFLVGIIVPAVLVMFALFGMFGIQATWIHQVIIWITDVLIKCNTLTYSTGLGSFDVTSPSLFFILFFIMSILFIFSEHFRIQKSRGKSKKNWLCIVMIAIIAFVGSFDPDDKFQSCDVVFVDVGQGDCVNLISQGNYIFDSGGKVDYNLGQKTLKPYLLKNQQENLDGAFITHNHTDHFKGACELSEVYNIQEFYFSKNYETIKEQLEKNAKADKYEYLDNSNKVTLDKDTQVEILWPKAGESNIDVEDENKNSMVMKVVKNGVSILITGDIDSQCEKNLLECYKGSDKLKATILKVAHHGSKYSTSDEFLEAVKPKTAIIQVGPNTYGHPAPETLQRLKNHSIETYRIDEHGAIGIRILDDKEYDVVKVIE